jgi:hypothetical protein
MINNSYDEIKDLLKKSKLIFEQREPEFMDNEPEFNQGGSEVTQSDSDFGRLNIGKSIQNKIYNSIENQDDDNTDGIANDQKEDPDDKYQKYRISGGILVLHGKNKMDLDITTDDKTTFQQTMDEFVSEVSDLVDFDELHVYKNNVQWGGNLIDDDLKFIYTVGENGGVYISADIVKVDEDFLGIISSLENFYQKFKSKWARVLSLRKKT